MKNPEDFYRREKEKLVNFIRKRLKDSRERSAEDIVQDVMLDIYRRWDVSVPINNLVAYVYRAIRNRIIDIYRQPQRSVDIEEQSLESLLSEMQADTYSEVESRQLREAIFKALAVLPGKQQEVWLATEVDEFGFRELSAFWDVPIGTLMARKKRANDRLKVLLKEYK